MPLPTLKALNVTHALSTLKTGYGEKKFGVLRVIKLTVCDKGLKHALWKVIKINARIRHHFFWS